MAETKGIGRRERKKAATRKAISDAATELFLERGFDDVSIREIAEKADVSPTTVLAHFPQKEALVFDEDEEQRAELVAVVTDRPKGTSLAQAFHEHLRDDVNANLVGHADFDAACVAPDPHRGRSRRGDAPTHPPEGHLKHRVSKKVINRLSATRCTDWEPPIGVWPLPL